MTVTVQLSIESAKALRRVLEDQIGILEKTRNRFEWRLEDPNGEDTQVREWLENELKEVNEQINAIKEYMIGIEDQVENL
jgi:predicted  nucleic acid-binding Zn-ribbon protein